MPDFSQFYYGFQSHLRISLVDGGVNSTLIGKTLKEAGVLGPGAYVCAIDTKGVNDIDVTLKPNAVTGAFAPAVTSTFVDRATTKATAAGAANFAAGVAQTLSLTSLRGVQVVRVTFTVPGGGSIDFTSGQAEANAL